MKTGGTLNFLKRAGAILMLVAVFASSCNKYADDFKQLNTKLDGLATSVGGLSALTADLASVKASVASALTAIAALPNAATHTAMQTSLTAVAASITTIQTNLAALTTTVNGLPKLADVNAIATKVAADLTIQLAKTQKAITDAMTTSDTKLTSAFSAAIAANNAVLDALVKGDLVANNAKIADAIIANNTAINAAIVANNKAISDAIVANNPAITAADAAAMVANNAAIAAEIVKNNPAIAVLIDANNAAISSAVVGNNSAIATLIQAGIDALKLAVSGTSTDAVTAATVNGLAAQLLAMKATLTTIYNNTIKTITTPIITGTAQVGLVLTASNAALETVSYQWRITTTVGGSTYADILGETSSTYKILPADLGKTIKVVATGTGSYVGTGATPTALTSAATAAVIDMTPMVSVATQRLVSGYTGTGLANQVGVTVRTGATDPSTATVSVQWQTSASSTGVYTTVGTSSTYTPSATDAGMWLRAVVTGTGGFTGVVTGPSAQITVAPVVATQFTAGVTHNLVTITLTGGTLKTSDLAINDFTWTGENSGLFVASTTVVTKVSSTVATIQLTGANKLTDLAVNAVAIPAATLSTPVTSIAIATSAAIQVGAPINSLPVSAAFSMSGMNTLVITMTGGTFASTITKDNFTFAGGDAALIRAGTFTRTSSTVVTVTNIVSGLAADNTVSVLASAQATQGTSAVGVGWTTLTSAVPTLVAANNTVTIVLTGGTFQTSVSQSKLVWAGTDAAALAAGTLTYVNSTTVFISGLSGLVGTNNTVTVIASGMLAQASSVAANATTNAALVTPAFTCSAAAGTVTVTLVGGTFPASFASGTFTSSTATIGTVTRTSSTTATIALSGAVVGSNVITLGAIGQLTPGTSVSVTTTY